MRLPGADVVSVPDFSGSAAGIFEARTLLFLGSWLDHAGAARGWPVHLACVGEPPASVRDLAARCDARITLHAALEGGRVPTYNKLLGFDIQPETDRLLLVDTDVIFLGDPSGLDALDDRLSLVPAGSHRVTLSTWEEVCGALGIPIPEQRIVSQRGELAARLPVRAVHGAKHRLPMVPYYNSGVMMVPWAQAAELRERWLTWMHRLVELFPPEEPRNQKISKEDQFGLALTIDEWEREHGAIQRLPAPLHASWILVMAGALRADEVALYHAVHFLRRGDPERFDPLHEVDLYRDFVMDHVYPPTLGGRTLRAWRNVVGEPPAISETRSLVERIRDVVERYLD
jgi:hypothetical protein